MYYLTKGGEFVLGLCLIKPHHKVYFVQLLLKGNPMRVLVFSAATLLMLTPSAFAEDLYAGISLGQATYTSTESGLDGGRTWEPVILTGKLGAKHDEIFATEIRYSMDLEAQSVDGGEFTRASQLGAFVKVGYENGTRFYPYAIGGLTRTVYETNGDSDSHETFALGVGVDVAVDDEFSVNLEYLTPIESFQPSSDLSVSSQETTLGVNYHF
jgi:opacity protein-like surface antigen